jgi:phosphate starvation-inducible PhoH-like protein
LKAESTPSSFFLTPEDNQRLAGLCGQFNANLKVIEEHLGVRISHRGNLFYVDGGEQQVQHAEGVLRTLYKETARSPELSQDRVFQVMNQEHGEESGDAGDEPVIRVRRLAVRGRNPRQREYLRSILQHDLSFGIGPAGTGKTYLGVACAVQALAADAVERIVLVRPAVEAGERLGYLPGDIGQKVDPYLRPLYDALYQMLGFERVGRLLERGVIELAPLAYMRGRTLNEAFVILDEAQNTTVEQMKMFLTRIGFGSKAVVTGDVTQVDLPKGTRSGLKHAERVLAGVNGISFTRFRHHDVVRHPLVQRVVEAYEREEEGESKNS